MTCLHRIGRQGPEHVNVRMSDGQSNITNVRSRSIHLSPAFSKPDSKYQENEDRTEGRRNKPIQPRRFQVM